MQQRDKWIYSYHLVFRVRMITALPTALQASTPVQLIPRVFKFPLPSHPEAESYLLRQTIASTQLKW